MLSLRLMLAPRIKIREHTDVSGQSRCVGTVDDFVAYFRDRFEREQNILRQHQTNLPTIRVDQLSQHPGEEVRMVVMVSDKRLTHNGNYFLELEDEYGQTKAIFTNKERNFQKGNGIDRKGRGQWPQVPRARWPDSTFLNELFHSAENVRNGSAI